MPPPPPRSKRFIRMSRTLPEYADASRIWHYHVICRHCTPKGYGPEGGVVIATRALAMALAREFNDNVHDIPTHRHVIQGCANATCTLGISTPG